MNQCFHCNLPIPKGFDASVVIDGKAQPMCCHGCEAVAQTIVDANMTEFYRFRTVTPDRPKEQVPAFLQQLQAYDHPQIQQKFVRQNSGQLREASLIIEGIVCAACVWLNERHLARLPGVISVNINYSTHRAEVQWDDSQSKLSQILAAISDIGYLAHPYDPSRQQALLERQRKQHLRRLGLAVVLGMQIMILAVAMYAGNWWGMQAEHKSLFQWLSLMLTAPLLIFSGQPFFAGAWRDLRLRRLGMDVPVALGLSFAFLGSVETTLSGIGHVYYDSIAMFISFVLGVRFFELSARREAAIASDMRLSETPRMATRVTADGENPETIAAIELKVADHILVQPGEVISADATVIEGHSSVDEALLSGESRPVNKQVGAKLIAGSINRDSPLLAQVTQVGENTVFASLLRLSAQAQSEKPALAHLADRIASHFVAVVLLLALTMALYGWWQADPAWLPVMVSVLVVTCPCALSLATPAALTAANSRLTQLGLLGLRPHVLENLSKVTHVVFDKTGTLTLGKPAVKNVILYSDKVTKDNVIAIAAALEQGSEHPLAQAIIAQANGLDLPSVNKRMNTPGKGIQGEIDSQVWYIGQADFIAEKTQQPLDKNHSNDTWVGLANGHGLVAVFELSDTLRPDAETVIKQLQQRGVQVSLLSGDHEQAVQTLSAQLGIPHAFAKQSPEDKLAYIQQRQSQGDIVAMIGDGINDAPVLAAADVSIAMGSGTQLAASHADMLLLSNNMRHLLSGFEIAERSFKIMRQNLTWALGYNILAVPAALMGYVPPWLAAVGMSLSSFVVVLNALRLRRME